MLATIAFAAAAPAASAAKRYHLKPNANVDKGGGIHLANTPGGFYMGRLKPGDTFDRHPFKYGKPQQTGPFYESKKKYNNTYAWGYAGGTVRQCLWLGPSAAERNVRLQNYLEPAHRTVGNRCPQSKIDFLEGRSGGNIGSHYNCKAWSKATFGAKTKLTHDADVWHNLEWSDDYRGGPPRDRVARLTRGTTVWYRYTTLDRNHAVVYVDEKIGWAFVKTGNVERVQGRYGAGDSSFKCKERRP